MYAKHTGRERNGKQARYLNISAPYKYIYISIERDLSMNNDSAMNSGRIGAGRSPRRGCFAATEKAAEKIAAEKIKGIISYSLTGICTAMTDRCNSIERRINQALEGKNGKKVLVSKSELEGILAEVATLRKNVADTKEVLHWYAENVKKG